MTRARLQDLAAAAVLLAFVFALWLGFVLFVPLDFTPPRPG
jgi:diacylglycerol kinase